MARPVFPLLVLALLLLVGPSQSQQTTPAPANSTVAQTPSPGASGDEGFACKNCLNRPVRAMYLYGADTTECTGAPGNGSLCDSPDTATPECFNWENWRGGWVGATIHKIFSEVNPPSIVAMTRANFSSEVYAEYDGGSSFTRCVYEIRLDNVDICVGNFWETADRRQLVPFSSAMLADTMRLVSVPRGFKAASSSSAEEDTGGFDYGTLYRNILQPFSNEVWYITLGMLVFGGLMMWFCESTVEDSPFEGEGIGGVFKSIWISLMSFVCATAAHEATHWPGRIVMIGYAFFIYVSVVLYVANLSAFLILKPSEGASISSLAEISRLGGKLCLLEAMSGAVEYAVPLNNQHLTDDYGPALERLYRGKCAAAVVGFFEYEMFINAQTASFTACIDPADDNGWSTCTNVPTDPVAIDLNCKCDDPEADVVTCPTTCPFGNKRYCPLVEVVDPSFELSLSFALPLKPYLQNYVSAWIIALRQNGVMEQNINVFARNNYCEVCGKSYSADSCKEINAKTEGAGTAAKTAVDQLDLAYMMGIYVWSAAIMVFGGVVSIISRVFEHYSVKAEPPMLDVDVDERDADITELVQYEGTHELDAVVFERKLEKDLDGLTTQMSTMMKRIRELEHMNTGLDGGAQD